MGLYEFLRLSKAKSKIKEGTYMDICFSGGDYTEPYTDEELQKIIKFEQAKKDRERGKEYYFVVSF